MEIGLRVGGGYDKSLMCFSDTTGSEYTSDAASPHIDMLFGILLISS